MNTEKKCDHKSAGMLVWKDNKLLLIERKKPPFGFAVPAGHVDADSSFEEAAKRELKEEVGLNAKSLQLIIEGKKENPCRRQGGNWHYWKIYKIETEGEVGPSKKETKQAEWYLTEEIRQLGSRTENYLRGEISEEEWQNSPGLEPIWYEWFKQLKII